MGNYELEYRDRIIKYQIIRKNVKNINLRIKPSLEVLVSANINVSEKYIIEFVNEKAEWIYKHILQFEKREVVIVDSKLINGEIVNYLGDKYVLEIVIIKANIVKKYDKKIIIYVSEKDNYLLVEKTFQNWLKKEAEIIFKKSLDRMYEKIKKYNIEYPRMTIRKMKTRWGSCSVNKGKININLNLIYEPVTSIDYVILHELVHFIYPNHSSGFYNLLKILMIDFEKRENDLNKKRLEGV
jgi:predicted metal-dependent hydrolase